MRKKLFSDDMATAPRDGSLIEVRYGPQEEIVLAYWIGQTQAFVCDDDPNRKPLHRVTAWRPAGQGPATRAKTPKPPPAQPVAVPQIEVERKPWEDAMTADDFAVMVEALIQQARADGVSDERLAEKLQDAADALREGLT